MSIRRILLLIVVAGALLAIGLVSVAGSQATGTLQLVLNLPDQDNLSAQLDGKPFKIQSLDTSSPLSTGHHTLELSKTGYQATSIAFDITKQNVTLLNARLTRINLPAIGSWQQVRDADHYAAGASIVQTVYFYDQTWAYLKISVFGSDTAVVVVHYDDAAAAWQVVLGPGTLFTHESLQTTPRDVENYMTKNGYADNGGVR